LNQIIIFATIGLGLIILFLVFRLYRLKTQQNKLLLKNKELETKNIRLDTELSLTQKSLETESSMYSQIQKHLENSFSNLAQQALRGNQQQFLDLAKQNFEKEELKIKNTLDKKQASMDNVLSPLKDILDKYQQQTTSLEKERQKSYFQVENELKKIAETNLQLSKETHALKTALKKPHVRGRWGEIQLKNCIDLAGMSEYCDVSFQDTTTMDDGSRLIPDMTVKMPGGRSVVVDAKTPLDAFLNTLEASKDPAELEAELIRHGQHVKKHIQQLSTKAYAQNLEDSADFTVMFLPNESFLYAALESQPDLVEYALAKKVLIATPPTLIGLLKVIRFGWNEERLAKNARQISEVGKELHKRVCDFTSAFTGIGRHLDKAQEEYQKVLTRLESRVLVQAKRLEKLGAKSNKELPEELMLLNEEQDNEDLEIQNSETFALGDPTDEGPKAGL